MFGLAGIVSNILAYAFYHIQGKDPLWSWQWMTICIAIISFIASAIVLVYLPDTPVQARWASDEDKTKFVERVRSNDQGIKQKKFKTEQMWEAFRDPFTWLLFTMMLFQTLVVGECQTIEIAKATPEMKQTFDHSITPSFLVLLADILGGLNTFNSILINSAFGFDVSNSSTLLLHRQPANSPGTHRSPRFDPSIRLPSVPLLPHRLARDEIPPNHPLHDWLYLCQYCRYHCPPHCRAEPQHSRWSPCCIVR